MLFLHEGLGSVRLWRGFRQRLAAATGRRPVAFSRLGHSGSDLPNAKWAPRYMHDEAAEVVPTLRAALGLERPSSCVRRSRRHRVPGKIDANSFDTVIDRLCSDFARSGSDRFPPRTGRGRQDSE
jgi:hypothetical protein